jgi:hypothetical protein
MQNIEALPSDLYELDNYTLSRIQGLPRGYLYNISQNTKFFQLLKSFSQEYLELYKQLDITANSIQNISVENIFLDEWLKTYGLPNPIFTDLVTTQSKVFAIQIMKTLKSLNSVESYEAFFALLGYEVKFYLINENLNYYSGFNYSFPISFSNTISTKDKITYYVYITPQANSILDLENIGSAFQIDFGNSNNNYFILQTILDFIKPDFILFQLIDTETKNLFNL